MTTRKSQLGNLCRSIKKKVSLLRADLQNHVSDTCAGDTGLPERPISPCFAATEEIRLRVKATRTTAIGSAGSSDGITPRQDGREEEELPDAEQQQQQDTDEDMLCDEHSLELYRLIVLGQLLGDGGTANAYQCYVREFSDKQEYDIGRRPFLSTSKGRIFVFEGEDFQIGWSRDAHLVNDARRFSAKLISNAHLQSMDTEIAILERIRCGVSLPFRNSFPILYDVIFIHDDDDGGDNETNSPATATTGSSNNDGTCTGIDPDGSSDHQSETENSMQDDMLRPVKNHKNPHSTSRRRKKKRRRSNIASFAPKLRAPDPRFDNKGQLYCMVLTEYLPGSDILTRMLDEAPKGFTEHAAAKIFRAIVLTLQELHRLGIYHMDIKLENVLLCDVDSRGVPHVAIIDMGSAMVWDPNSSVRIRSHLGTEAYHAPEQFQRKEYTPLGIDLWNLGTCLFVLTTGFFPFNFRDPERLPSLVINCDYPTMPSMSADLKDLLSKLLVRRPSSRISIAQILDHDWMSGVRHQTATSYGREEKLLRAISAGTYRS